MLTSPFQILVDTREVKPWRFSNIPSRNGIGKILVRTKRFNLGNSCGDYTIEGASIREKHKWRISIERKSLSDLYTTIIGNRVRFIKELENLNKMEYAAVVCEALHTRVLGYTAPHWTELGLPVEAQLKKRRQVAGSIRAWSVEYPRVHWWFLPRVQAEIWVYNLMNKFWEKKMKGKKK